MQFIIFLVCLSILFQSGHQIFQIILDFDWFLDLGAEELIQNLQVHLIGHFNLLFDFYENTLQLLFVTVIVLLKQLYISLNQLLRFLDFIHEQFRFFFVAFVFFSDELLSPLQRDDVIGELSFFAQADGAYYLFVQLAVQTQRFTVDIAE